ncbi:unnamed protein product [Gordionus sp. m RMFG-2023]|uniref:N-acetylated-alpha-linked acidic dipeptidase 2-like n=1 Tax=Gordionus sp. m RMFG-2023 TaxID=3053472 RepID=UPI0030DF8CAE
MAGYKQHENDPTADTELESWPEDINGRVRVYGPSFKKMIPRSNVLSVLAMSIVLSLCFGVLIGYFGHAVHHPEDHCYSDTLVRLTSEAHDKITEDILSNVKEINIKHYLDHLTKKVHLAGTERQRQLANDISSEWTKNKLDNVQTITYDVMLSYPDSDKPNRVSLLDQYGNVQWVSSKMEKPLRADEEDPNIVAPFNAYSASGSVTSDLVYVNYGRFEDFQLLQTEFNVSLQGKIAIARYGMNFRGSKVKHAETFNLSGIILYSDPRDSAPHSGNVFPNSWWMPDSGVQRGTVYDMNGDPLTIGYPANTYMYRELPRKGLLPAIPVYPISYSDAYHLLNGMGGAPVPVSWKGALNLTYRTGPGFLDDKKYWKVKFEVNLKSQRKPIYNVLARINGTIEPDRYVILGNHRDAWTFGATDPSSGTACLLEISRVLAKLHEQGWKPRRTIIFASWDAEEYSIIGSTEYVEDRVKILRERAVAYLNVDISVLGNYSLRIDASPLLTQVAYDVAKMIPNPNPLEVKLGRKTVYDTWLYTATTSDTANSHYSTDNQPRIGVLGSGSDFVAFVNIAGVPSIDMRYMFDRKRMDISTYPLYHTRHDTFFDAINYIDPDFVYHKAVSQYWGELARVLADSYVLPFTPFHYGKALKRFLHGIVQAYDTTIIRNDINLNPLTEAVKDFQDGCLAFATRYPNFSFHPDDDNQINDINYSPSHSSHGDTHNANKNPSENPRADPVQVRAFNDKLMQIERAFLDPGGSPLQPWYKHLIFAPSSLNFYNGSGFPALSDLLYLLTNLPFDKDRNERNFDPSRDSIFRRIHELLISTANHYSSLNELSLTAPSYYNSDHAKALIMGTFGLEKLAMDFENPAPFHVNMVDGGNSRKITKHLLLKVIHKHIAVLAFTIRSATSVLED